MNIYVGNLSADVTQEELRIVFEAFGEVTSVVVMNDRYIGSGQSKAYGYVGMESKSAGVAAIAGLNGKRLDSRVIEVIEALPLSDRRSIVSGHEGGNWSGRRAGRTRY